MDDDVTVDATTDPDPTDEPAAVGPPGRSRLAVVMWAAAGLLVVVAIVFGVLGFQAQSAATDERDQAAAATRLRRASAVREREFDDEREQLDDDVRALPDKYDAVGGSYVDLIDAHNHYIDIANHAADLYNGGDAAGAIGLFQHDGAAAINDVNAKRTATQQAVQAAEDALHHLQEGL